MPEIGEVARIVHYIRKHLVGRTIKTCEAFTDDIVYGKVGCSSSAFQSHVVGRKVVAADRQGKYFYMLFDKAPHAVMHFGMTGWMKFDVEDSAYYKKAVVPEGGGGKEKKEEDWPPKYMKFLLKCEADGEREAVEAAFVDPRRLARIRLVDCEADEIRNHSPLKENGPDPVRDKQIVTVEWLSQLLKRKKVPVKALLLDQANISGVGNWVADEIMYQARLHPEQYSHTFSDEQIESLHKALMDVCTLAVETNADSSQFPETWLMKHRWNKGKKGAEANVLPNGEKIVHVTVGGRTSAIVPSVQKKTAAAAGDVGGDYGDGKPAKRGKRKAKAVEKEEDDGEEEVAKPATRRQRAAKKAKVEPESSEGEDEEVKKPAPKKAKGAKKAKVEPESSEEEVTVPTKKSSRSRKSTEVKAEDVQANGGAEDQDEVEKPAKTAKKAAPKKAGATVTTSSRKSARSKT
ncbi:hypothetical protein LTR56_021702 [Elasticomyces elasticus]|nr:hypothetical protein LTR56_021702 [Elasticomyces elasticus]KAK3630604.1 hypothetical protein LTR22_021406 [Elasticomyces elasticus]KAK4909134.1 hypothetical protein LTR49_022033 [Elasticomyces elasticus]KAK5749230.1 hypothetical protein LTS12_020741 [Elasticomyces elasticus]